MNIRRKLNSFIDIRGAGFNDQLRKYEYELKNGDMVFIAPRDMDKVNILHDSIQGHKYGAVFDETEYEMYGNKEIIGFIQKVRVMPLQ